MGFDIDWELSIHRNRASPEGWCPFSFCMILKLHCCQMCFPRFSKSTD